MKENLKVVIWGDSICCTPPGSCWGDILQGIFTASYNPGCTLNVVNSGVGGMPARVAVTQFQEKVAAFEPDLVIICFGMNDMRYTGSRPGLPISTPDEFEGFMDTMIRQCRGIGAEVLVLGYHLPDTFGTLPGGKTRAELTKIYNTSSKKVAGKNQADFIDISQVDLHGAHPRDTVVGDGVHLNDYGARVYYGTVASWLAAYCMKHD